MCGEEYSTHHDAVPGEYLSGLRNDAEVCTQRTGKPVKDTEAWVHTSTNTVDDARRQAAKALKEAMDEQAREVRRDAPERPAD